MAKRNLLFCTAVIIGVVLVGGIVCLVGNPVSGDTWGRKFPHSYLYLSSHQEPAAFRVDHVKSEVGVTFGRCSYIWSRH